MSKKVLLVLVLLAFAGSTFAQLVDDYSHYPVGVDVTSRYNSVPLPSTLSTTKNCYGTLSVTEMPSGSHYMRGSTNQTAVLLEHGGVYCDVSRSSTGVTNGVSQAVPFGDFSSWCVRVGGTADGCAGTYTLHVQKGTTGGGSN